MPEAHDIAGKPGWIPSDHTAGTPCPTGVIIAFSPLSNTLSTARVSIVRSLKKIRFNSDFPATISFPMLLTGEPHAGLNAGIK
jgi:hypothetical protein